MHRLRCDLWPAGAAVPDKEAMGDFRQPRSQVPDNYHLLCPCNIAAGGNLAAAQTALGRVIYIAACDIHTLGSLVLIDLRLHAVRVIVPFKVEIVSDELVISLVFFDDIGLPCKKSLSRAFSGIFCIPHQGSYLWCRGYQERHPSHPHGCSSNQVQTPC